MQYLNDKIKQLMHERDNIIKEYNIKIEDEIIKEKAKYKVNYRRLLFMIFSVLFMVMAMEINKIIFPKTSIWSWQYYFSDKIKIIIKIYLIIH